MRNVVFGLALLGAVWAGHNPQPTPFNAAPTAPAATVGWPYCPEGPVNQVVPNYLTEGPKESCEYVVTYERTDRFDPSGWIVIGEISGIWSISRAHNLMFRTGQCGVVLYGPGGWESPGVFYAAGMLRVTAVRQPPCSP